MELRLPVGGSCPAGNRPAEIVKSQANKTEYGNAATEMEASLLSLSKGISRDPIPKNVLNDGSGDIPVGGALRPLLPLATFFSAEPLVLLDPGEKLEGWLVI